jgi:hypothetical protein
LRLDWSSGPPIGCLVEEQGEENPQRAVSLGSDRWVLLIYVSSKLDPGGGVGVAQKGPVFPLRETDSGSLLFAA